MKLCCLFGNHHYSLVNTKVHKVAENDKAIAFRVDDQCVDCGRPFVCFIKINRDDFLKPPSMEEIWYRT